MGSLVANGQPGRGGISRGRGDAAMQYGDETAGRTDEFEVELLTPGSQLDLERSQVVGVAATAPTVAPTHQASTQGANTSGEAGGSWRRRLSPSHRRAVRTFFDAGAGDGKDR